MFAKEGMELGKYLLKEIKSNIQKIVSEQSPEHFKETAEQE
jgi:hypothetical protein